MKASLKGLLSSLFSHSSPSYVATPSQDQLRCNGILNYWLDSELFDLPECPISRRKDSTSFSAEEFKAWLKDKEQQLINSKAKISDKTKLVIMFQCHYAGYLIEPDEVHPNYKTPLTYLVAQAFIPSWDNEAKSITWTLSEDNSDTVINLAAIRTFYRRCPNSAAKKMNLLDWVEARMEMIETCLNNYFTQESKEPLSSEQFFAAIIDVNRALSREFWPDAAARRFMQERATPAEATLAENEKPHCTKDAITFRWRFCFYPQGNETTQLGPFFADDLETLIASNQRSINELSLPLQRFLLGSKQKTMIGSALDTSHVLYPLTTRLPSGRWPENPNYGLSLLQTVAVNVAANIEKNPIVAVNGPPGTGKTTLLKDIIAERFVKRTFAFLKMDTSAELLNDDALDSIMAASIVVTSSNNKAVENISKELPSISKIAADYQDEIHHFRGVADASDWGLFCAVLGNSNNRQEFKGIIKNIEAHLNGLKDHFQFNHFYNSLKNKSAANSGPVLQKFLDHWHNSQQLITLAEQIQDSRIRAEHKEIAHDFTQACLAIANGELSLEDYIKQWQALDEQHWESRLEWVDTMKRQWYARDLATQAIENKFQHAKERFNQAIKRYHSCAQTIKKGDFSEWGLDANKHLLHANSYRLLANEEPATKEAELQIRSPFSSKEVNHCRSQLFITALAFNEALIELKASEFDEQIFAELALLIDGKLDTQELKPQHRKLWATLFLFFPVVSTSLASVQNQFRLMQKKEEFGLAIVDEAGQAVSYHVAGLLQRSRQAIFVGDPIQLEPVVTVPNAIDLSIAHDFMQVSTEDGQHAWGDDYRISVSSAQSIADKASRYAARIGDREVGIPLLVHRRCTEPMFSIANKIAYNDKMILATLPNKTPGLPSSWIHVDEAEAKNKGAGYNNISEAEVALDLIKFLCETQPDMVKGGVYIITPFTAMSVTLRKQWLQRANDSNNHKWMQSAFGEAAMEADLSSFANTHIGTVHTFQGKEASTVIFCTAASKARQKAGGIQWVNSKPNLINVAVTRAKYHFFVVGNKDDWEQGAVSKELQLNDMLCFEDLESFKQQ